MKYISPGISTPEITSPTTSSLVVSSPIDLSGSLNITGSLDVSGSVTVGDTININNINFLHGADFTSSWAANAITSSYALTASSAPNYVLNSVTSSMTVATASYVSDINIITRSQQAAGSVIKGYNVGCPIIMLATNGQSLSSGVCVYTAIYIDTTTTITGVKFQQQTQGNYTANNYNGVGLYQASGGTLTLVASSSNDGNIWKGAQNTLQSKSFASTYSASPGIYYIGALYSTSAQTTAPAISFAGSAASGTATLGVIDFTNSNKTNGTAGSGLTTLATSIAASSVTAVQHRYAFYLY